MCRPRFISAVDVDRLVDELQPGESRRLGGDDVLWTTVERSGDGKVIRFVRHRPDGFEVFREVAALKA